MKYMLEKGRAPHSVILVWGIPWTEEPGGLQCMGLQKRHVPLVMALLESVLLNPKPKQGAKEIYVKPVTLLGCSQWVRSPDNILPTLAWD